MSDIHTPINAVNPNSYGLYGENMGPDLAGQPNDRERHTLKVEFILDAVPGAYHQPEDLVSWIMQNPYVTGVQFKGKD